MAVLELDSFLKSSLDTFYSIVSSNKNSNHTSIPHLIGMCGGDNHYLQTLTPYSAVSSFNLPAQYDSSLITPVSLTSSPSIPTRGGPLLQETDVKLSPSMSPFQYFDDEGFGSRYNQPMKYKESSSQFLYHKEGPFESSMSPPTPYFGSYGVSTNTGSIFSARTMESSSTALRSPPLSSAGSYSATDYRSHQSNPSIPTSSSMSYTRQAAKKEKKPYQGSRQSSSVSIYSNLSPLSCYNQESSSSPPRNPKRKSSEISDSREYEVILPEHATHEDRLLLGLVLPGTYNWKQISGMFSKAVGKDHTAACLQMRKSRMLQRFEENSMNGTWADWDEGKWKILAAMCEAVSKGAGSKKPKPRNLRSKKAQL